MAQPILIYKKSYSVPKEFDVEAMKQIIRENAGEETFSLYNYDGRGYYALGLVSLCIEKFGTDFLREMIAIGYKPNPKWSRMATACVMDGTPPIPLLKEAITILMEAGDVIRQVPNNGICSTPEVMEFLRGNGFELTYWLFHSSLTREGVAYLMEKGVKVVPAKVMYYKEDTIRYLVELGWDINEKDEQDSSALYYMMSSSYKDHISLLLSLGADPELPCRCGSITPRKRYNETGRSWERDFGFSPFLVDVAGNSWRIMRHDDNELIASTLTVADGLIEKRTEYALLYNKGPKKTELVCVFSLDGHLVQYKFN